MKFFLLLVAVLVGVWLFRSGRQDKVTRQSPPPAPAGPQEMADCPVCGVHFPKADAVTGRKGLYCSDEHRQRVES